MLLPQSLMATLIVMIFGMLCLGTWAITYKLSGNWRFELYYFDFVFGVLVVALLLAFTLGSIGYDGFQFTDDLLHAGKRQWFYAFVAGIIFNLGNMFLMGSLSVSGMSVAFPLAIGGSVVVGTLLNLLLRRGDNPLMMLGGSLLVTAAIVVGGIAYTMLRVQQHEELARSGKAKSLRRPSSAKGILLALIAGLVLGSFAPLIRNAMEGDLGLGPYAVGALFALGMFFSTFAYNIFFVNLPVEGEPADIGEYFKAHPKTHLLGLVGGALWALGATAVLVGPMAPGAPQMANLGAPPNYLLAQAFPLIAALWGLLYFKEFRGSTGKTMLMTALMLVFYLGGILLIAIAPLYVRSVA